MRNKTKQLTSQNAEPPACGRAQHMVDAALVCHPCAGQRRRAVDLRPLRYPFRGQEVPSRPPFSIGPCHANERAGMFMWRVRMEGALLVLAANRSQRRAGAESARSLAGGRCS